MDLQEQALSVMAGTQTLKRHEWEAHKQRDMMPVLGYLVEGAEELGQVPDVLVQGALALTQDLGTTVHTIFSSAKGALDFRTLIVVVDGYTSIRDEMPERKGTLEDDFKSNPASDVSEAVIVTLASRDMVGGCDVATATSCYRVTDGGVIVFDEPDVQQGEGVQGRVAEALRLVFTEQEAAS